MVSINLFVFEITDLRSDAYESFLCDAFECKPCKVVVKQLTGAEIAQIFRKLQERSKSRTKPKSKPSVQQKVEEIHQEKCRVDKIFKPPIPMPVNEVEIETMNHEGKFRQHYNKINRYFNVVFVFLSAHQHQKRIRLEHNYSR